MARGLTAGMIAELTADTVRPILLFEWVAYGSTIRYWSGRNDLSWDSKTWLGNSMFKGIGQISESRSIQAAGLSIMLAGEPSSIISLQLNSTRTGQAGKLWLGFLNSSGAVIADPYQLFSGKLSESNLSDGVKESTLELVFESDLIILEKSSGKRYTHEDQQIDYPGDLGFEYVPQLEDFTGYWGKGKTKPSKKKKNRGK